jgi:hypothetical protein
VTRRNTQRRWDRRFAHFGDAAGAVADKQLRPSLPGGRRVSGAGAISAAWLLGLLAVVTWVDPGSIPAFRLVSASLVVVGVLLVTWAIKSAPAKLDSVPDDEAHTRRTNGDSRPPES